MDEMLKVYREITIIAGISIFIIVLCVSIFFIKIHFDNNRLEELNYEDDSELSYKVWLKENEYFSGDYIKEDNQYIADLIDNIEADFEYEFSLEEKLSYFYNYTIMAVARAVDTKTGKTIYEFPESIAEKKLSRINDKLFVNEEITIDYNRYNDLINKFVLQYDLKNVDCNLIVSMNVNVSGDTKNFKKDEITAMELAIPLVANTVSIDTNYKVLDSERVLTIMSDESVDKTWLYIGCITMIIDFGILIGLIIYTKKTETEEDKYKSEVRKIINTYDSYISRIQDEFNMEGYQILKVASFVDLLEIRDTMHVPIIMLGNEENLTTCFMIPAPNNILYFFSLGVTQYALPSGSDNKEELEQNIEEVPAVVSSNNTLIENENAEEEEL